MMRACIGPSHSQKVAASRVLVGRASANGPLLTTMAQMARLLFVLALVLLVSVIVVMTTGACGGKIELYGI